MRSHRLYLLLALVNGLTLLGFTISSMQLSAAVAHAASSTNPPTSSSAIAAAPSVTYTLYLPLIFRSCTTTQLLQDTGFEAGSPNAFWQTTSSKSSSILDNTTSIPSPISTHGGSWKAWLGGSDSASESLWQNFAVPAGTSSLSLSFWRRIDTNEPIPNQIDSLEIQIRNSISTTLQKPYTLYSLDWGTTWVQQSLSITPTYAGQNIQVAFVAATDSTKPTSFFIDDVTVSACH